MRITVISAGEAGATFAHGLLTHLETSAPDTGTTEVTVIAHTGDDISLWGMRLCPDLDRLVDTTGMTIGDQADSRDVQEGAATLGLEPQWYPITDRELSIHLARTAWLSRGESLSEVTARLVARSARGDHPMRVLPMSDVPVETHAVLDGPDDQQAVHIQQWRHDLGSPPVARFVVAGMDRATPAPGVLDAIRGADIVLLPPSDPVIGLGIVLGVPGVRDALRGTAATVVGVSPASTHRDTPAELSTSLATLGVQASAGGVASLYRDLLTGWLVDPDDAATATGPWTTQPLSQRVDTADPVTLAAECLSFAQSLRSAGHHRVGR